MKDTSAAMERAMSGRLMALSGEERLKMGCSMFDMARELVLASLPPCTPQEQRRRIFLRFYGSDFDPDRRDRILAYLSEEPRQR